MCLVFLLVTIICVVFPPSPNIRTAHITQTDNHNLMMPRVSAVRFIPLPPFWMKSFLSLEKDSLICFFFFRILPEAFNHNPVGFGVLKDWG